MTLYATVNKKIACTPFAVKAAATKVENGFATVENKAALTALTVVFPGRLEEGPVEVGNKVYVKADGFLTYGKEEFEVDGKRFILVPSDRICMVSAEDEE